MFSPADFPRTLIAIAVSAAVTASARAQEASPASEGTVVATQTYFPTAGSIDNERINSAAVIGRINADYAYSRGITGKGVTIAIMDTGIAASHREFAESGKLAQGFNAITGGTNVNDTFGHGTHVAGLLGADRDGRGIFGVAYDAQLLPIKVLTDAGSGSTDILDRGLRYAIGKAAIANMSLGTSTSYNPGALRDAVRSGLLIVAAAGNDGAANPGWPARFAKEVWANNQIIAVGAVDSANRIASFSNRAGDAAAWYLVAPGVHIASTYLNGQYAYASGTSMATPVVSGAAALIKQMWPALRADQIANILFVTATDLGAPGIDPVYGRGLLNVQKALQPIGALTTTTFNGRTINVLSGATQVSAATSQLWSLAASGQLHVIGMDDYQRDFKADLGYTVARPAGMSLQQVLDSMNNRIDVAERVLPDGSRFVAAYAREPALAGSMQERAQTPRLTAFSLLSKQANGREAAIGTGGLAAQYFGAGGLEVAEGMALGAVSALANPYFTLVPGASHAGIGQRIGDVKLKFGLLTSGLNQMLGSQDVYLPSGTLNLPRVNSALFEVSESFGDAALSVSLSHTDENNAYLGSVSSGPVALGTNTSTRALQVAGAVLIAPKLALAGQAAYGITPGNINNGNLITEVTDTRTNAFSLAVVASDRIKPGDRFSLSLSQPMRTYSGQIAMDVLTGLNSDGSQTRDRLRFSMVPFGREMRMEMNYSTPAGQDASIGLIFMLRREPNNLVDSPVEKLMALRYVKRF